MQTSWLPDGAAAVLLGAVSVLVAAVPSGGTRVGPRSYRWHPVGACMRSHVGSGDPVMVNVALHHDRRRGGILCRAEGNRGDRPGRQRAGLCDVARLYRRR